ncbi:MAG: quinoprotein dehydrogenase-associated putative ABC transporter substrate-binding protein [Pseudomonadales bacterium]
MPFLHAIFSLLLLVLVSTTAHGGMAFPDALRVCSDPNNLPYSNQWEEGFENKIAELIASDLKLELEYTWFPQRMGFIRNTLKFWDDEQERFRCDLVIGVPEGFDISDTTLPYYRSTYAIVLKATGPLAHIKTAQALAELPMEQKKALRVGAFTRSPAVDWLSKFEFFENTTFYQIMTGDAEYYPGKIIEEELVPGNLDVVVVWGPIAGYFASRHPKASLRVIPMLNQPGFQFDFSMAMGIRRRENDWKNRIEKSITDNREAILGILNQYQVPLVAAQSSALSATGSRN